MNSESHDSEEAIRQLAQASRDADVVGLAAALISIPSVNPMGHAAADEPYESKLTEYLSEWCRLNEVEGYKQSVDGRRENFIAIVRGKTPSRVIILDAHQDTVPVEQMTIPPFEARESNGKLYGRGACDVKGSIAGILATLRHLQRSADPPPFSVIATFAVDEEHQQLGALAVTERWADIQWAFQLDDSRPVSALVSEPTNLNVVVAHRGVVRWSLTTKGRAAHSSNPREGENAIYHMARVLDRLRTYADRLSDEMPTHLRCGDATLSVGVIRGGASVNVVPDECSIEIDRRLLPGESAVAARQLVIDELTGADLPAVTHSEPWCVSLPLSEALNDRLGEQLEKCVRSRGISSERIGVGFGTHAPRFEAMGIPTVVFGPGAIEQAHTDDEWIDVAQLRQFEKILLDWCRDQEQRI